MRRKRGNTNIKILQSQIQNLAIKEEKNDEHIAQKSDTEIRGSGASRELPVVEKIKKVQQRLVLLEGMIMAGNINKELIDEVNDILDGLVKSQQLPQKQASRMKKRIERTYNSIKSTI